MHLAKTSVLLSLCVFAVAHQAEAANPPLAATLQEQNRDTCDAVAMDICGETLRPQAGVVGTVRTFSLPDRFTHRQVMLQCAAHINNKSYYEVVNIDEVDCKVGSCGAQTVDVCNTPIAVADPAPVGGTVEVKIPPVLVDPQAVSANLSFTARCMMKDGVTYYEVTDAHNVSCSSFLCQPVSLPVCQSLVDIMQPSTLGTVQYLSSRDGEPVTVSCFGGNGQPPQYTVTQHQCY